MIFSFAQFIYCLKTFCGGLFQFLKPSISQLIPAALKNNVLSLYGWKKRRIFYKIFTFSGSKMIRTRVKNFFFQIKF